MSKLKGLFLVLFLIFAFIAYNYFSTGEKDLNELDFTNNKVTAVEKKSDNRYEIKTSQGVIKISSYKKNDIDVKNYFKKMTETIDSFYRDYSVPYAGPISQKIVCQKEEMPQFYDGYYHYLANEQFAPLPCGQINSSVYKVKAYYLECGILNYVVQVFTPSQAAESTENVRCQE